MCANSLYGTLVSTFENSHWFIDSTCGGAYVWGLPITVGGGGPRLFCSLMARTGHNTMGAGCELVGGGAGCEWVAGWVE